MSNQSKGLISLKNIYIILTRSNTILSAAIAASTGEPYTHASIAFGDDFTKMYSFARVYSRFPLPAGLKEENLFRGFYKKRSSMPCALLSLSVDDKAYYAAKSHVYDMMCRRREYGYNLLGLFLCRMRISRESKRHFFCSQFVSKIISEYCSVKLPKAPSLMHPSDFLDMPELERIYIGEFGDVRTLKPIKSLRGGLLASEMSR